MRPLAGLGSVTIVAGLVLGCEAVRSIEPVIPESEAIFEPALVGTWESGSEEQVVVARDGDEYDLLFTGPRGDVAEFDARLGYLGGRVVLEVSPAASERHGSDPSDESIPASHMVFFLDLRADTLSIATLDADSALRMLNDGRLDLPFVAERRQGAHDILLTATSDRLRSELSDYVNRPGVIDGAGRGRLHRVAGQ